MHFQQKHCCLVLLAFIIAILLNTVTCNGVNTRHQKWSSQDLMPGLINDVVGDDPTKLKELVKYPIPCDTKYECKRRTQFGKKKMKCQICPNQLYIVSSKYYEADKDTEKSPYAEKDKMPGEESDDSNTRGSDDENEESGGTGPASSSSSTAKLSSSSTAASASSGGSGGTASAAPKCQKKEDDQFILPCCIPETNDDGTLKIVPPNTTPEGELQCCGGGSACCRWCSEYVCDDLEKSNEILPQLWWHVCNDKDVDETTSKRFHQDIADRAKPSDQKLLRNGMRL
jgi:hypothetical protein